MARRSRESSERVGSAPSVAQLTAELESERSLKELMEKQKARLKQKVEDLEARLRTETNARDEMESETRKTRLDLRRMERELKAATEDRDHAVHPPPAQRRTPVSPTNFMVIKPSFLVVNLSFLAANLLKKQ